jgi:hypothetical protein
MYIICINYYIHILIIIIQRVSRKSTSLEECKRKYFRKCVDKGETKKLQGCPNYFLSKYDLLHLVTHENRILGCIVSSSSSYSYVKHVV